MKRTITDFRGFNLSRINEPQFAHAKFLLTWLVYFALYFLTENLIPAEKCHVMHCALDDIIPFCEYFAVFYVGWYFLIVVSLGYYFFYDAKRFSQLQLYIFITQIVAMAVYILYPSRQDMRPEFFSRENIFTFVMGVIYAFDTSTGVCPSLHVAYSIAIFSVVSKDEYVPRYMKVLLFILVVLISLATCFVKQHSMIDVFAAIPTALIGEWLIFHTGLFERVTAKQRQ